MGLKKRIEKLEALQPQNEISIFDLVHVDCGENGYPVDEKNLEILRKAEAANVGGKGIYAACMCQIGVLGLDQKIKAEAERLAVDNQDKAT